LTDELTSKESYSTHRKCDARSQSERAIEHYTRIDVIGQIRVTFDAPGNAHLGLVHAPKGCSTMLFENSWKTIEDMIRSHVDVDKVIQIAESAPPMPRYA